jgi:hypothetical protein
MRSLAYLKVVCVVGGNVFAGFEHWAYRQRLNRLRSSSCRLRLAFDSR